MAVLLETTYGDLVIDLFYEECPSSCRNFVRLCKLKHYNNCLFHKVVKDFLCFAGDSGEKRKGIPIAPNGSALWAKELEGPKVWLKKKKDGEEGGGVSPSKARAGI